MCIQLYPRYSFKKKRKKYACTLCNRNTQTALAHKITKTVDYEHIVQDTQTIKVPDNQLEAETEVNFHKST